MLSKFVNVFFIVFSILVTQKVIAQSVTYDIFQLRFLYDQIRFEDVILVGNQLLENQPDISREGLGEIHKFLALSYFNTGKPDSSRAHFYSLLSLQPGFELDPIQTSPKIIDFFSTIKKAFRADLDEKIAIPYKQYVFQEDRRTQAGLRSIALPGWGQLYKHQKKRGYVFGGLFIGSAAAASLVYLFERDLRDKYQLERDRNKISDRYNSYNNTAKTRKLFQYAVAGIWLTSVLDAFIKDYKPQLKADKNTIGLAVEINF
ncbi:MAG: hypothetical protein DWQ05_17945 [Calditrichaeota bacterium]|nr:MAG: hypothetical protein DWQ05_17945 [Calditrichota bacterium]